MAKKIIFLDRDGVILDNSEHYYIYKQSDMKYNPGVTEKLKGYAQKGFEFIIISNQSGISKGVYKVSDTEKIHQKIKIDFKKAGLSVIDDFFCPHHPSETKCFCRKPDSLMIEKAMAKWKVDKKNCFLVGDSKSDILAAEKAGIRGILVVANGNLEDNTEF